MTTLDQLIPLYIYPDLQNATGAWNTVIAKRQANPSVGMVVIADCDNGPGTAADPNYAAAIAALQAAGVTVLGYVDTAYAQYTEAQVNAQILLWKQWYDVDGIFFDDMITSVGEEAYYAALVAYAKSPTGGGMKFCAANPGVPPPLSYCGIMDVLVVYEAAGFPTLTQCQAFATLQSVQALAVIINGATSVSTTSLGQIQNSVKYWYITQEPGWTATSQTNTYGTLSQWI